LEEVSNELPAFLPEIANHLDSSKVLSALAKIDEVYQAAVALFYLEDYPYKDIAAILDVPVGTIKSRIARGIGQLREILLCDGSSVVFGDKATPSSAEESATSSENFLFIKPLISEQQRR
jgi:RNA polymerase sigma-70 factor, ECF subfamily